MPARLAERRYVRQDNEAAESLQCPGQEGAEVGGGLVAQGGESPQAIPLVQPGQFLDQQVVVEQDLGASVVAEPAIAPAVVADQAGLLGQRDYPGLAQVDEPGRAGAERRDLGADAGDRAPVEV